MQCDDYATTFFTITSKIHIKTFQFALITNSETEFPVLAYSIACNIENPHLIETIMEFSFEFIGVVNHPQHCKCVVETAKSAHNIPQAKHNSRNMINYNVIQLK